MSRLRPFFVLAVTGALALTGCGNTSDNSAQEEKRFIAALNRYCSTAQKLSQELTSRLVFTGNPSPEAVLSTVRSGFGDYADKLEAATRTFQAVPAPGDIEAAQIRRFNGALDELQSLIRRAATDVTKLKPVSSSAPKLQRIAESVQAFEPSSESDLPKKYEDAATACGGAT